MTSCSIIIYNYESLHFLKACVRQIRKYAHPEIEQHIIIAEQSNETSNKEVWALYGKDPDITIVNMKAICSGYAIDFIMRFVNINSEYICTLDVDAFPIDANWLYKSIEKLQEGFSFVGVHADIESAYAKYGNFFCMSQYFRVGRTEDYKMLSLEAGFTRFTHRWQIPTSGSIKIPIINFKNNEWAQRARELNEDGWSDSGVTAHWWEDRHTENNKFCYAITHTIGEHGREPLYGRITGGLVFHFGFSFTSIGSEGNMGERYLEWTRRIKEDFSDELIEEMLAACQPIYSPIPEEVWDGKVKKKLIIES